MARNEETLDIVTYAERLPEDLTGRQVYLLDPMLATGGTLIEAIKFLRERGAESITCVCLIAAPEGIAALEKGVEGLRNIDLFLAAKDERLNEKAYIVPGLGDCRRPPLRAGAVAHPYGSDDSARAVLDVGCRKHVLWRLDSDDCARSVGPSGPLHAVMCPLHHMYLRVRRKTLVVHESPVPLGASAPERGNCARSVCGQER